MKALCYWELLNLNSKQLPKMHNIAEKIVETASNIISRVIKGSRSLILRTLGAELLADCFEGNTLFKVFQSKRGFSADERNSFSQCIFLEIVCSLESLLIVGILFVKHVCSSEP